MYTTVIFDFFDVIHRDPFKAWLKSQGLERIGIQEAASRRLDAGEISDQQFYRELAKISGQPVGEVAQAFSDTSLIDKQMIELIAQVRRNYKTGLISNCSVEYLAEIINRHELHELFDSITVSAAIGHVKPEPEIFHHALEDLRVKPEGAIFIDDNPNYAAGAEAVGLKTIVYTDIDSLRFYLKELAIKL